MRKAREVRLAEDEVAFCEQFERDHGLVALLDHLGLDGIANAANARVAEIAALKDALERIAALDRQIDTAKAIAREALGREVR